VKNDDRWQNQKESVVHLPLDFLPDFACHHPDVIHPLDEDIRNPIWCVEISFKNSKLAKVLNSERELVRANGQDNGRRIGRRLQNIADAANLDELSRLPQTRVHELIGDRDEQISVDVKHPYRLILACIKHGKRDVFIEAANGAADPETLRKEAEADTFASDFLIPKIAFAQLRQQRPFTTETVQRFAAELGIAPGIVVGRLQHERLIPHTHLNGLKRHFRLQDPTESQIG
jgi:plasmid maintenance system killer protein